MHWFDQFRISLLFFFLVCLQCQCQNHELVLFGAYLVVLLLAPLWLHLLCILTCHLAHCCTIFLGHLGIDIEIHISKSERSTTCHLALLNTIRVSALGLIGICLQMHLIMGEFLLNISWCDSADCLNHLINVYIFALGCISVVFNPPLTVLIHLCRILALANIGHIVVSSLKYVFGFSHFCVFRSGHFWRYLLGWLGHQVPGVIDRPNPAGDLDCLASAPNNQIRECCLISYKIPKLLKI